MVTESIVLALYRVQRGITFRAFELEVPCACDHQILRIGLRSNNSSS